MAETLRERGRNRKLCTCGEPHTIRIMVQAREKATSGSGVVIYTSYRSVCEACANTIIDLIEKGWPR